MKADKDTVAKGHNVLHGLVYGFSACGLWGLSYVLPEFVPNLSTGEIVVGRYLLYGLFSLFLVLSAQQRGRRNALKLRYLPVGIAMAFCGFLCYDALDVTNVKLLGSATVCSLSGAAVVITTSLSNLLGRNPVPWQNLWMTIALMCIGTLTLSWRSVSTSDAPGLQLLGWGIALETLQTFLWVAYTGIASYWLATHPDLTTEDLTSLTGLVCLVLCGGYVTYAAMTSNIGIVEWYQAKQDKELLSLVIVSCISGVFVLWLASDLWCRAATKLPMAVLPLFLAGDVIFGQIYSFSRAPSQWTGNEVIGTCFIAAAIIYGCFKVSPKTPPAPILTTA